MNYEREILTRKEQGLYRQRKILDAAQGARVSINNKKFINFSSNDYLGLANNQALKKNMINAIDRFGLGSGSSQLIAGYSSAHQELEETLAEFLKRDAALVFTSGYQANLAIASALIDVNTIIFQDKYNHASLIDAALLSKGKLTRYRHNDMNHLHQLLEKNEAKHRVVMTDALFSMDGDLARLADLSKLCEKYNALLIVDDAHGCGVFGKQGAGTLEMLKLDQFQVPLMVGTFGKAFGLSGAFIAGEKILIEQFIQKARTYIYTTAMMPAIAETAMHAIGLVQENASLRKKLFDHIHYFKQLSSDARLKVQESDSQIQPLHIGCPVKTMDISNKLLDQGILVGAIRPPTVQPGTSRLRISLTASHSKSQIDTLIASLKHVLN